MTTKSIHAGKTTVVTWEAPSGGRKNVCKSCEAKHRAAGTWPKNSVGEEYCQVYKGAHLGRCEVCHTNYYAVVDANNVVVRFHTDARDAGHPEVCRAMDSITSDGNRWVYVEERCKVGDMLEVDEDGCAIVVA